MAMFLHVRAKPRRTAFELDLPDKSALHERIERVVNCGMGNIRHRFFGTNIDFIRRGMIALVLDHVIDAAPLRRETKAADVQPFAEILICFFLDRIHLKIKIATNPTLVKI